MRKPWKSRPLSRRQFRLLTSTIRLTPGTVMVPVWRSSLSEAERLELETQEGVMDDEGGNARPAWA